MSYVPAVSWGSPSAVSPVTEGLGAARRPVPAVWSETWELASGHLSGSISPATAPLYGRTEPPPEVTSQTAGRNRTHPLLEETYGLGGERAPVTKSKKRCPERGACGNMVYLSTSEALGLLTRNSAHHQ